MRTQLNYSVKPEDKKKPFEPSTKTALSMQATLENALNARQPGGGGGLSVAQNPDGFGRSV